MTIDQKLFNDINDHSLHLVASHRNRNDMDDELEKIFLMNWDDEYRVKRLYEDVKITKSPDPRNSLLGAIRLLAAADPQISIPSDQSSSEYTEGYFDNLERYAGLMWTIAGRIRGDPIHFDVIRSALLFGEVHIGVTSTADLLDFNKDNKPAYRQRAEQIARDCPYLFDVFDPRTGYPEYDELGLVSYYREVEMTGRELIGKFGERKEYANAPFSEFTVCDWWDMTYRQVWIKGEGLPLIQEEHGLPFIPVAVSMVEGSRLHEEPEYHRQPMLYTVWKSELWERMNMALTVMYSNVFAIGSNPQFVEEMSPSGGEAQVDFDTPGGVIKVPPGGKFYPMMKGNILDPAFQAAFDQARNLNTESTIYRQTLGEPLGPGSAYSMVSLLHQAGRLPLVMAQRKCAWVISDALRIALLWTKYNKKKSRLTYGENTYSVEPSEIPDGLVVDVKLEVSLPQDKLEMSNVAAAISGGEDPLMPKGWVRENILQAKQPNQLQEAINTEQASRMYFQIWMQQQMARAQMQLQMEQQQIAMQQQQAQQQMMMQQQQAAQQPVMEQGVPPEQTGMVPGEEMEPEEGMTNAGNVPIPGY